MSISARAVTTATCGKAILVGEHAVLYGATAIAIPLPKLSFRLETILTNDETRGFFFDGQPVNSVVDKVIQLACQKLQVNASRLHINAYSEIPVGAGLGSSAALCVGLVKNLMYLSDQPLEEDAIVRLATELEHTFHGESSGLDCAVVTHAKPVAFMRAKTPRFLEEPIPTGFLLIDSLKRSSTQTMIEKAAIHFSEHPSLTIEFDGITQRMEQAISQKNEVAIAREINTAQKYLSLIDVVGEMQEIVDVCLASGAAAAKVTGAGGGGCILCYAPLNKPEVIQSLAKKLPSARIYNVD